MRRRNSSGWPFSWPQGLAVVLVGALAVVIANNLGFVYYLILLGLIALVAICLRLIGKS